MTNYIEFPIEGKFPNIRYGRFMCCGDSADSNSNNNIVEEPLEIRPPNTWSLPRPWTNASGAGPSSMSRPWTSVGGTGPPFGTRKKANQPFDTFLKRSIPYVALGLDQSGKNIIVDTIISNVYIKVPENSVSVAAILSTMATKLNCDANELVILDVKFLEISDDKGR